MFRLLLLFILLPAAELVLLIEIGRHVGTLATLGLIVVTGAIGATLARGQGLRVLGEMNRQIEAGRLPAGSLVDGVLVLLAAAVLVTPGILTDAFGFLCLVPAVRAVFKRWLLKRFEKAVAERHVQFEVFDGGFGPPGRERPMKDITPERSDDA